MKKFTRYQWIKCPIAVGFYLLFLWWIRSWWGLLVVPFIFDLYITKKIPWSFWKEIKNPTIRSFMSWADAIVFSLIGLYFVNIYLFQNYQIPSSSLEKSLLVGDFLFVSKVSYGARVPNTPLSMPMTQHTFPVLNTKSYLEHPQWPYKRVAGLGRVKHNDIVVFNFPAGDTVALNYQQTDFYSLTYAQGKSLYPHGINMDSLTREQQQIVFDLYYNAGKKHILANPSQYGKVIHRPVDRRENYVKRCIGLPGDTLQIIHRAIHLNGIKQEDPEGIQFFYHVQATGKPIPPEFFRKLGLSNEDTQGYQSGAAEFYLPLTKKAYDALFGRKDLVTAIHTVEWGGEGLYPPNLYTNWTTDNYGPVWIPAKGATVTLTNDNLPVYERCICAYERNTLERKSDGIYINGEKTNTYTFKMDYYWMMGDNRHNSADSRYWGFVPEDHVVGKPIVVWLSLDKDRDWLSGKIRWERIFKWVHQ
ncbi:Signal peptidase I [termite gut metagenome]|uniref:signal peptidase I n=1 Tax=termite gut metagenome TaxID=433724 RepID=A0A5J4RN76_9ZZZZ